MKSTWKHLVRKLKADGFESTYLDRLAERIPALREHRSVEHEIMEEMAYALGQSCNKVNFELLELDVLDRKIQEETDPERRAKMVETFNRKRKAARRARWELKVHREALGFLRNDELEDIYPIPPKRRLDDD
jgi:hypothetical protein